MTSRYSAQVRERAAVLLSMLASQRVWWMFISDLAGQTGPVVRLAYLAWEASMANEVGGWRELYAEAEAIIRNGEL